MSRWDATTRASLERAQRAGLRRLRRALLPIHDECLALTDESRQLDLFDQARQPRLVEQVDALRKLARSLQARADRVARAQAGAAGETP